MRVCQFRHDGNSDSVTGRPLRATLRERTTAIILQARRRLSNFKDQASASSIKVLLSELARSSEREPIR